MRILFIGNTRIGDFILSSGLIAHLLEAYPDARLTIACGYTCKPLTRHIPRIERVIAMRKTSFNRHWLKLWQQVCGTHWDLVIDLRNSAVSRLVRKNKAYRLVRPIGLHKVEEAARVLGLSPAPNPKIWIGEEHRAYAHMLIPDGMQVIGIGPGASHLFKRWPAENFAELCARLIAPGGPHPDAKIAVLGSPEERALAQPIFDRLPQNQVLDLMKRANLLQAAAILERCALYIGNDNGQMHLSAAMGAKTIGLFGPTPTALYRPWGENCSFVCSQVPQAELAAIEKKLGRDAQCLMEGVDLNAILAKVQ